MTRLFLPAFLVLLSLDSAIATSKPSPRLATEPEIRQGLHGTAELSEASNGYLYRQGSRIGYKISDGQICVRTAGHSDCFTIYTDGKRLELIDSKGNRSFLRARPRIGVE